MTINTVAAGREIARAAMDGEATMDTLSGFDRDVMGGSTSVRINIPLLDPVHATGALKLLIRDLQTLLLNVERLPTDRSQLMLIRETCSVLNKRINAHRQKGKSRF